MRSKSMPDGGVADMDGMDVDAEWDANAACAPPSWEDAFDWKRSRSIPSDVIFAGPVNAGFGVRKMSCGPGHCGDAEVTPADASRACACNDADVGERDNTLSETGARLSVRLGLLMLMLAGRMPASSRLVLLVLAGLMLGSSTLALLLLTGLVLASSTLAVAAPAVPILAEPMLADARLVAPWPALPLPTALLPAVTLREMTLLAAPLPAAILLIAPEPAAPLVFATAAWLLSLKFLVSAAAWPLSLNKLPAAPRCLRRIIFAPMPNEPAPLTVLAGLRISMADAALGRLAEPSAVTAPDLTASLPIAALESIAFAVDGKVAAVNAMAFLFAGSEGAGLRAMTVRIANSRGAFETTGA
jgi:hypothetical protein